MEKIDTRLNLYVTASMHRDIEHMAKENDRTVSYIVREAVAEYMSKRTPPAEVVMIDDSVPNSKPDNEHTDNNGFDLGDIKY